MKWTFGNVAFMIGFFGAIIVGLLGAFKVFELGAWTSAILIVAGLLIGFLNAKESEKMPLMIASLVIGGGAGVLSSLAFVGIYIAAILAALALVAVPAGVVIGVMVFMNKGK